jgi:hypothetical protein
MKIVNGQIGAYNYTTESPEELIFAYSKSVYFKASIRDTSGNPSKGLKIRLSLQLNGRIYNEYRYTDSNGDVIFNAARLLQSIKNDRDKELANVMYDANDYASWEMSEVFVGMAIDDGMSSAMLSLPYLSYILVNGSHDNIRNWWDKRKRLRYWTNYPFTFDLPNVDYLIFKRINDAKWSSLSGFKVQTGLNYLFMRYTPDKVFSSLAGTPNKVIISTQANLGIMIKNGEITRTTNSCLLDVDRQERRSDKTYLRWLGSHGELFYWLFDNVTEEIAVKTDVYQRAIVDSEFTGLVTNKIRDNGLVRDSRQSVSRVITTDFLEAEYFELVQSVAASPYVDMLVGEGDDEKWQRVNVADVTFQRSLRTAERAKNSRIVLSIQIEEQ